MKRKALKAETVLATSFLTLSMLSLLITYFLLTRTTVRCLSSEELQNCPNEKEILPHSTKIDMINSFSQATLDCYSDLRTNLPGMAVTVVKDNEIFTVRGFGLADTFEGRRVDENTMFEIASITKSFTALLTLQVLEDNQLDITTKLVDILGTNFRYLDEDLTNRVTVGDLLAHRTGLAPYNYLRYHYNFSREALARNMAHLETKKPYRDSFIYNSLSYGLLAYVAETVGQEPWEDILRKRVFEPLGMTRTALRSQTSNVPNDAVGNVCTEDGVCGAVSPDFLKLWGKIGSSGSVMSSAVDMSKWMRVLLNDGRSTNGHMVFTKSVIDTAFTARVSDPENSWSYSKPVFPVTNALEHYASGLRTGYYRGYKSVMHTGTTFGYTSIMTLIPSENLGVFIVYNGMDRNYRLRVALTAYILDVMLNETPWLNAVSELCSFPEPWATAPRQESLTYLDFNTRLDHKTTPLSQYVGVYGSRAFGKLFVSYPGSGDSLQVRYGFLEGKLYRLGRRNNFAFQGTGLMSFHRRRYNIDFHFITNGNNIESLRIPYLDEKYPPIFKKLV